MRNFTRLKSIFSFAVLLTAMLGATHIYAQNPTPTPKEEKKMEEMDHSKMNMPKPTPTPKVEKMDHSKMNMPMPSPTPTPTPKEEKMDMKMDMPMDKSSDKKDEMDMKMDGDMAMPTPTPTPERADSPFPLPPPGKDFPSPIEDNRNHSFVLFELLEYQATANSKNSINWDMIGWYGGDYNRLWFRSEGAIEQASTSSGDVEFQALYGRMIAPYYDVQVGLRYDQQWKGSERNSRFHAVFGLVGLVPYEYEVEPLLFVSNKGDVSFRFTGVKDIFINQRTIFEGRFETNLAVQSVEKFGVGSGLNDTTFGVRIRREITREFAPYIGISYTRLFGQTADFARLEGGRADRFSIVAGVRMWF